MRELCKLEEIPNNEAKGLITEVDGKQRNIFIIRKGKSVFGYINWCPHNQVLIDQIPNKFFNADKTFIQCSKHGALFNIEDGLCIKGPCEGDQLKPLKISLNTDMIILKD